MVEQTKFRPVLNDIAKRSFRDVADNDYITARLCYQNQLFVQYIWQSQQCLEKYLKAILLFNKVPTKKLGHNLKKAADKIAEEVTDINFKLSEQTYKYLENMTIWGVNRYLEKGHFISPMNSIQSLDKAVWELRHYCRYFDRNFDGFSLEIHAISEAIPNEMHPRIYNGLLEKIIDNDKHFHHEILMWVNKYFGGFEGELNIPLNAINPTQILHPEYFEQLKEYIQFPKDVIQAFKEQNESNRKQQ
jgi:HEPN domain-containing protein